MELNGTLDNLIMRIDWKCNNADVLLIDAQSKVDLRELYICWSHTTNDKIFLHWGFQELTIDGKEFALESPFIFNSKSHVLVAISLVHESCNLRISTFFTTFLNKNIDGSIEFEMINLKIWEINRNDLKTTFHEHNHRVFEYDAIPFFNCEEIIHVTLVERFVWKKSKVLLVITICF